MSVPGRIMDVMQEVGGAPGTCLVPTMRDLRIPAAGWICLFDLQT